MEQLREDLYTEPLRPVEEMQDVVNILNEQSKVVARILNDVLSLQKIEDGALQLEMAPFNLLEMICGTLRSFQPLFTEKKLSLLTELQSLEECLATHARKAWKRADAHQRELDIAAGRPPIGLDDGENSLEASPAQPSRSHHLPPVGERESDVEMPDLKPSARLDFQRQASLSTQSLPGYESELSRSAYNYSHDVLGDRYRLRQVFANFLSNAVKFSTWQSNVSVSVSCKAVETPQERAVRKAEQAERKKKLQAKQAEGSHAASAGKAGAVAVTIQEEATEEKEQLDPSHPLPVQPSETSLNSQPVTLSSGFVWTPPTQVMVRVSVRDSGRGLSLFEQQQLFQPYIQLSSGEQQNGKGTGAFYSGQGEKLFVHPYSWSVFTLCFLDTPGLGLNISKSLIELHGGIIGVTSSGVSGAGCQFFFEIPMSIVPSGHRSVSVSPQVFHVSNMKGPATMRAWHSPAVPLRGLAGAVPTTDSPASSVNISVNGPEGTTLSLPKSLQPQKNSPSLFSLQSVQHTAAPLTVAVRQRMLERSHQGNASLSVERREFHPPTVSAHMPADMVSFSPLVGSSRRVASTLRSQLSSINVNSNSTANLDAPPALSSPLVLKDVPMTPGTQQVNMISSSPPLVNSHLSKLALLQGLANESVGYGFGYSSRPPVAQVPPAKSTLGLPSSTTHVKDDDSTEMALAPVLTPMEDDEVHEADLTSAPVLNASMTGAEARAFTPTPGWNTLPSHIETPQQGALPGDVSLPPMPTRGVAQRVYVEPNLEVPAHDRADGHSQQRASGSVRRQSFDSSSSNSTSTSRPLTLTQPLNVEAANVAPEDTVALLSEVPKDASASSASSSDADASHGSITDLQKVSASKDAKQFRSIRLHVGLSQSRAISAVNSSETTPIASPSAGPMEQNRPAGDDVGESPVGYTPASTTVITPGSSTSSTSTTPASSIQSITSNAVTTTVTPAPSAASSTSGAAATPSFRPRILVVEVSR